MKTINTVSKRDVFYLINKYTSQFSRLELEYLLAFLFNCSRIDLYVKDFVVDDKAEAAFDSLIKRRLKGEPVQYIIGYAEFMGLVFSVTEDVFIPRPETELLVGEALKCAEDFNRGTINVLDLCTGSGNVAVCMAKNRADSKVFAVDVSCKALEIARKNSFAHGVCDRVSFYKGDFNVLLFDKSTKFDIILCNPPYIKQEDIPFLQREVRMEPDIALNGGRDGLDFYRILSRESAGYLNKGGYLIIEIGYGQAEEIADIFNESGRFEISRITKDFNDIERVITLTRI